MTRSQVFILASSLSGFVTGFLLTTDNSRDSAPRTSLAEVLLSVESENVSDAQAEMEFLIARDPRINRIPEDIRRRELEFAKQLPQRSERSFAKPNEAPVWTERGPNNIGGRTRVFAADITNPNTLIAGAVAGGIWKSTDDGASWRLTTQPWQIHTTTCIAQDTRSGKTHIWYIGTGEFRGSTTNNTRWGSFYRGDGIYKSTDNGENWTLLPSTSSGTPNTTDAFDYIWNIAVNPANLVQDEVYAATWNGIYRSTDGGTTWTLIQPSDSGQVNTAGLTTDVVVTSTGVVYAHTEQGGSPRIWRSTDGVTWTDIKPGNFPTSTGRIVFGPAPSNPDVVYVFVESANTTPAVAGHQVWKYTHAPGGGTWENRGGNLPSGLSTQAGYDMMIHVKPDDENFVLIGGTNLYRSTNGFATNTATTTIGGYPYWPGQNHHPDLHSGFFRPGNPTVYYSGHDGGLSKTTDIAASSVVWSNLNNGYNVTQFYSVSISPDSGDNGILAGAQDNGSLATFQPGMSAWEMVSSGDGTVVELAPMADDRMYTQSQNGPLYRQTRSGANFTSMNPSGATRQLFVNPIALDPNDSRILYYGAGKSTSPTMWSGLWRNDNAPNGTSTAGWTALTVTDVGAPSGWTRAVSAIGISKTNRSNVVYFGTTDGIVKRVDNANSATPIVTDITPPGLNGGTAQGGFVRAVAVDPTNSDKALLAFGNYNFQSLWYTTNGGTTWRDVEGNLAGPSGPSVRWATIFYIDTVMHVFLGTSIGLLSTTNLADSQTVWVQEASSTIGNILIAMIDYREVDRTIAVGTHARGAFTAQFSSPLDVNERGDRIAADFMLYQNYPNPFNPVTTIGFRIKETGFATLKVYDMVGREVATLVEGIKHPGYHEVTWDAREFASGVYFCMLRTNNSLATRKLILLR